MRRSNFKLALLLALAGCSAFDTPLPSSGETELRAVLAGLVRRDRLRLCFSRPAPAPAGWLDTASYSLDSTTFRLRGFLRWNAAIGNDAALWTTDSFDLLPEHSEVLRMRRDTLLGDLLLRSPELATASAAALAALPSTVLAHYDSLWNARCRAAGRDSTVFRSVGDSLIQTPLDTSLLRQVCLGSTAVWTVLAAGDSICLPVSRSVPLLARLETSAVTPVLRWSASHLEAAHLIDTADSTAWPSAHDAPLTQVLFHLGGATGTRGVTVIQLSGTCAALAAWQHGNSANRSETPTGNTAPFNGYFCTLEPDTISFPEMSR